MDVGGPEGRAEQGTGVPGIRILDHEMQQGPSWVLYDQVLRVMFFMKTLADIESNVL